MYVGGFGSAQQARNHGRAGVIAILGYADRHPEKKMSGLSALPGHINGAAYLSLRETAGPQGNNANAVIRHELLDTRFRRPYEPLAGDMQSADELGIFATRRIVSRIEPRALDRETGGHAKAGISRAKQLPSSRHILAMCFFQIARVEIAGEICISGRGCRKTWRNRTKGRVGACSLKRRDQLGQPTFVKRCLIIVEEHDISTPRSRHSRVSRRGKPCLWLVDVSNAFALRVPGYLDRFHYPALAALTRIVDNENLEFRARKRLRHTTLHRQLEFMPAIDRGDDDGDFHPSVLANGRPKG